MNSLAWTFMLLCQHLMIRASPSLGALTAHQLVLHRSAEEGTSTLILSIDESSYQWREHQVGVKCYCLSSPTGVRGLNNDVIILGGHTDYRCNKGIFVMLEPKRLQQLAMKIIYQYKNDLPWRSLPPSLICKLVGTENG